MKPYDYRRQPALDLLVYIGLGLAVVALGASLGVLVAAAVCGP